MIGVVLAVFSFPLFGTSAIGGGFTFAMLSWLINSRVSEPTEEALGRMKNVPFIVGLISAAIYLRGLILFVSLQLPAGNAAGLVFVLALFPVLVISVMGGIITGLITFAVLSLLMLIHRHASPRTDCGGA
jgi:hypothetical protein